jgi:MYXO-CTERM domain-containing protein
MGAASASISVTVDNSAHGSVSGSVGGKGGCLSSTGAVGGLALLGLFALRRKR